MDLPPERSDEIHKTIMETFKEVFHAKKPELNKSKAKPPDGFQRKEENNFSEKHRKLGALKELWFQGDEPTRQNISNFLLSKTVMRGVWGNLQQDFQDKLEYRAAAEGLLPRWTELNLEENLFEDCKPDLANQCLQAFQEFFSVAVPGSGLMALTIALLNTEIGVATFVTESGFKFISQPFHNSAIEFLNLAFTHLRQSLLCGKHQLVEIHPMFENIQIVPLPIVYPTHETMDYKIYQLKVRSWIENSPQKKNLFILLLKKCLSIDEFGSICIPGYSDSNSTIRKFETEQFQKYKYAVSNKLINFRDIFNPTTCSEAVKFTNIVPNLLAKSSSSVFCSVAKLAEPSVFPNSLENKQKVIFEYNGDL